MQRLTCFIMIFLGLGFATAARAESIKSFDVTAELTSNRKLIVTENIRYDFEALQKHGIYRVIPEKYARLGAAYRLHLNILEAKVDGQPVAMEISRWGADVKIRLGAEDVTLTGEHLYTLRYETERALNDFPDEAETELYWNITGNGWEVPIEAASFRLVGPSIPTKTICYAGPSGSAIKDCTFKTQGSTVTSMTTRTMYPGDGLTVAVRFSLRDIAPLTFKQIAWNFLTDNLWLGLPFLALIIMYGIWNLKGRDPRGRGTVVAQYEEPRGLRPAELAAMQEEHVSSRAITATLLDLARRGFLKIRWEGDPADTGWFKAKPKFTLIKIEDVKGDLLPFESELYQALFEDSDEVKAEEHNAGFWKGIQAARDLIFQNLKSKKYYANSPARTRAIWLGLAVVVALASFFMIVFYGVLFAASGLASAAIVAIFGWVMPRVTREGAVIREEIEGFKLFLSVTEKDRLAFHNAPAKRPDQFERFLPAAIAFGVEKQWAENFKDLQMQPPSYMEGSNTAWNSLAFAHAIDAWHNQSSSHMYQAPSSAGSGGSGFSGGSSGGGFGGGGGGSW